MAEVRGLYSVIQLRDRISAPLRKTNASLDRTKTKMGGVGLAVNKLKTKMRGASGVIKQHQMAFAALGAAFTAIGYGGMRILLGSAKELESVFGYLEAQTGALDNELNILKETVVHLARVNSDAFAVIGSTIAITRKRFGELGDETTSVNQTFLDFAKIAKTDAVASTEALTKIMKAYDIPAQDAVKVTDLLLAAQAKYGINSAKVNRALGEQSAALRIWGMSLEESIGLLSAMDAAGIDTSRALTSLKTAASEFETPEQFWEYMEELAAIGNAAERTTAAEKVFGASAGPAMALMLDDGVDAMRSYILTQDEVAGATKKASAIIDETLSEQLGILKSNLKLVSAEMGKTLVPMLKIVGAMVLRLSDFFMGLPKGIKFVIAVVAGLVTAFALVAGPVLLMAAAFTMAMPTLTAFVPAAIAAGFATGGLTGAMSALAVSVWAVIAPLLPIIAVIALLVGAVLLLQHAWVKNWGDIQGKTKKVTDFLKNTFGWILKKFNAIRKFLPLLLGPIGAIYFAFKNWGKIKDVLSRTGSAIKTKLGDAIGGIIKKLEPIRRFLPLLLGPIGAIYMAFKNWDKIIELLSNLKDIFFDAGTNLIKAFVDGIKAFATAPIDAIKEIGERIRAFLPFSDAEMGPLADITVSGRKLVETFGKGIASEMPVLGNLAKLMPAPAEMLSASTTSITNAPHSEDRRVSIGKIELHIDGASGNAEEIGDTVIHRIKREFEKYGI